ncbi:MAG: T9SS type A sorting domain-containing protein [Chitinophagaceae bacterium]
MTPNPTRASIASYAIPLSFLQKSRFEGILRFLSTEKLRFTFGRFLFLLSLLTFCFSSSRAQTTYDFTTNATISGGPNGFGIWNTQADITVGGVAYRLTCGGNGSFTNSATGGNGNGKCLAKDGSGGDLVTIKRADNQPFQFYGLWIKHFSMKGYMGATNFVQVDYVKTAGGTETWADPTPTGGSGTTTLQLTLTKNVTVTEVTVRFYAIMNFWINDLIVGPAAGASPPAITANPPNRTICAGGNTTFTVTATNATSYQWQVNSGSGFGNIPNGGVYSNATTSTLNITGATAGMNGYLYRCVASGSASPAATSSYGTLTVNSVSGTISATDVTCNGGANGTATVVASGGVTPYSYSWSPSGGTAATATGLPANTYTVTITDNLNCQTTRSITVNQPAAITASISKTDVSCNGGTNGTATVSAVSGGTGPYTYSWSPSGGTNATATGLGVGTYTCTITDNKGCQITRSITINQPSALTGTISKTDVSCNGGANGTATVVASGGTAPYTYSWSPSGGTNATATGLGVGTYTCTITDNKGCQITRSITINQPTALAASISKTDVSCNGGGNGTATVSGVTGGTGPYTYSWSPSGGTAATATGLAAGTYTCTITDNNTCQITRSITINQPTAISASVSKTDVTCNGGANGTATVSGVTGGTAPYTYSWSPSGGTAATATGLAAGPYTVTITDNNTCQITRSVTITQPAPVTASISKTDVSCNGGTNGTATVSGVTGGSGSYSYSWSPSGGTAATATGLAAGTYTCTITDITSSCQITRSITLNQPTALSGTTSKTDVSCNGGANGSATVSVTGGTAPYTYSWAPSGGTAATATGLAAGAYTVTITDNNNCQITRSVTVNQPTALSGTASKTDVSCNGGTNGTASVSVSGGTAPYTYSWAPSGGTAATATGLAAGAYTVTITDNNNCQITRSVTVNQPTALSGTASKTDVSCNGGTNGTASVSVSGGTAPYTYSWSPSGGTAATATGLAAGTYTVTITDNNNCQITRSVTVNQPTALSATTSKTDVSCNGGANGTASVSVSGGTAPYTYSWSPSGGTAATATGLAAGAYTVTITDNNNCQITRSVTVNQPTALSATASKTDVSCNGGANGTASVSVSGGTAPYTYSWSPSGGTAATATGLAAGTYTVTITDNNNCQITRSVTVNQPTALSGTASKTDVSCNGGANGTASVSVSGGTAPYTYSWSPSGGTAATATGLAAGTYTVTITDNNNCQITRSVTVNQPVVLTATSSFVDESCAGALNGSATVIPSGGTAPYTYSWSPSGGAAATATGLAAGTYSCTITDAKGCSISKTVTISTKPLPTVQAVSSQTLCNQSSVTAVNFSGTVTGTVYNWTNSAPGIGLAASGNGNIAAFAASNNGTAPVVATIQVTPVADGCTGSSKTFTITVNPTPAVDAVDNQVVCNKATQPAVSFHSSVSGVTYQWTNDQTVIGLAASGNGNLPSFTAINNTDEPIVATIRVTPAANGCPGPVRIFTITVNPTPGVDEIDPVVVCNNGTVNAVEPGGSPVTGTTYNWTNSLPSIGLAASGTGTIPAFTAVNSTSSIQTATIEVTPVANACSGPAVQYTITVNPTPVADVPANQVVCVGGNTQAVNFNGPVSGTTYTWTNDKTSIGLPASGTGNIPAFAATNTGTTSLLATIRVTPHANGCEGPAQTFTITVKAASQAPTQITASKTALCGDGKVDLQVNGGALGTGAVWKWYKDACGGTSIGQGASLQQVQVDETTTFYVRAEGDCNTTACASVTVVVNAQPVITIAAAPYTSLMPGMFTTLTATITPQEEGLITWYRDNTWVPSSNSNTLQVNVDGLGAYKAKYTTVHGCIAFSNEVVIKDSASARMFIGPNPNNGLFTVRYYQQGNSNVKPRQLMVFDSKGALVFSKAFAPTAPYSSMQVNLTGHAHGIYFVRLVDGNGKVVGKDQVRIF